MRLAALVALALLGAGAGAAAQEACVPGDGDVIARVCYEAAPGHPAYGHNVLGDTPEWSGLRIDWGAGAPAGATAGQATLYPLGPDSIYEDIAPRLVEIDSDPFPELLLVEARRGQGARVVVIDMSEAGVSSVYGPFIGTQNRWLAPLGAADLDGDGAVEIAYIDRPHLARTLRVFRFAGGALTEVAALRGLTNHKIGEAFISGGIRDCGQGPEIITADAAWQQIVATRIVGGALEARAVAPFQGPASFGPVLDCARP